MEELRDRSPLDKVHLQWFAEDDTDPEGSEDPSSSDPDNLDSTTIDDPETKELQVDGLTEAELKTLVRKMEENNKKLAGLARDRLHEIMEKKQKLRDVEKQESEDKQKALEEKEKFKELYSDIKPKYEVLEKDVVKTHDFFNKEVERAKVSLPEEYHKLIPNGDVREQLKWINSFMLILPKMQAKEADPKDDSTGTTVKTTVGSSGSKPPESGGSSKDSAKSTIEQQIQECKTAEELEQLLSSYRK